jgi:hypothetical protein
MEMNNEVEFTSPSHSLLLKSGTLGEDKQGYKNKITSIHALPQVARKKISQG